MLERTSALSEESFQAASKAARDAFAGPSGYSNLRSWLYREDWHVVIDLGLELLHF